MADANRDQNHVPVALGQSSTSATTTLPFKIDSSTGRLLVDSASGSGTVTSVSVVTANGVSGSVADPTTTPAITITLGAITPSSVVATGTVRSNTGLIVEETGAGTDTITIQAPASIAASYTLTLPVDDGASGEVLSTDGNGVLSWISAGGVPTTITVANEATDISCFIAFFTAATGDLGPKTNANMTFNSNTGVATFASTVLTTTDINGGTIDGTIIGGASAAAATITTLIITSFGGNWTNAGRTVADLGIVTTVDINGGTIDGTTIGASSATTIVGTTITANTSFLPDADGGAALGSATLGFTILGLASASTINFANGNVLLTHSSGILTMGTGDLRVTNAGANTASVVTVGGTQTLTAKTLTAPTINAATLSGIITLAESTSIDLDPAQGDGTWTGITRTGTAGATLAFGDLCYLAAADSRWELTDADSATTADRLLGMCVLAAAADGDPTRMLLMGNIQAASKFPAMTIGSAMYISDATAGAIITTIPTGADNVIRRVGYALTADELYFNPSMDAQTTVA